MFETIIAVDYVHRKSIENELLNKGYWDSDMIYSKLRTGTLQTGEKRRIDRKILQDMEKIVESSKKYSGVKISCHNCTRVWYKSSHVQKIVKLI